ncbi:uncharacterized protein LOC125235142 [Leguminivora glycinivorella]|uniref:uncharacterized protein LOC125235142 n=1 Tax=Leguminivora glycinivorella TaxID=1035111 RepID=UPI00200C7C33|nr:uncharacterized protein LOC125235142 [Leguminivora glycinivorella]
MPNGFPRPKKWKASSETSPFQWLHTLQEKSEQTEERVALLDAYHARLPRYCDDAEGRGRGREAPPQPRARRQKANIVVFLPSKKGRRLVIEGYSFYKHIAGYKTRWRCAMHVGGCRAVAFTIGDDLINVKNYHNHMAHHNTCNSDICI